MRAAFLFVVSMCILPAWALAEGTWFGKVIDQTTGAGLGGCRVCAGIPGRVDITRVKSQPDGSFTVSYPRGFSLSRSGPPMLYVDFSQGGMYYSQYRQRPFPGEATVSLVPLNFFITGEVVSADTGQPIPNADVSLTIPGAVLDHKSTDVADRFSFGPIRAYNNSANQYNSYGVPSTELPKNPDPPLVERPYGLKAHAAGYASVESKVVNGESLPHISRRPSSSNAIASQEKIRLPKAGVQVPDPTNYIENAGASGVERAKPAAPDSQPVDLTGIWIGYNAKGDDLGANTITQTGKNITIVHPNGQVTRGGYIVDESSIYVPVWGSKGKISTDCSRIDFEGGSVNGISLVRNSGSPSVSSPATQPEPQPGTETGSAPAPEPSPGPTTSPDTEKISCCGHPCSLMDALKALQMAVKKLPPEMCLDVDKNGQIDSNDAYKIFRAY